VELYPEGDRAVPGVTFSFPWAGKADLVALEPVVPKRGTRKILKQP